MKNRRPVRRLDPNTVALIKQISIGVFSMLLVAGLLTSVWHGTRIDRFTLSEVRVSGGETIDHDVVRERVQEQLEGDYLGFIPRRFAWTYPYNDLVATVAEVERVHDIKVRTTDGRTVDVSFDEYRPNALWCSGPDSSDCVFLDDEGYAYAPAPELRGGSLTRLSHTSNEPEVGKTLTNAEDFQHLGELQSLLEDIGWYVSWIEIDAARDAFLRIVDGGEFKVSLETTPQNTIDNLQVILTSEDFSHLEPGNFSYVDLRFGNKVFVNEELMSPEDSLASSTASTTLSIETVE